MLQRMDALEAEIRRLASLTEDLQIRVDSVVRDGTNRVGDLEFRLCELEADCDIASLGETPNLGGVEPSGRRPGHFGHADDPGRDRSLPLPSRTISTAPARRSRQGLRGRVGGASWPSRRPIPAAP
jgi:hypothetical protein